MPLLLHKPTPPVVSCLHGGPCTMLTSHAALERKQQGNPRARTFTKEILPEERLTRLSAMHIFLPLLQPASPCPTSAMHCSLCGNKLLNLNSSSASNPALKCSRSLHKTSPNVPSDSPMLSIPLHVHSVSTCGQAASILPYHGSSS